MRQLTFGRSKFRIRILYKSGNSHESWFTSFKIKTHPNSHETYSWDTLDTFVRPIVLGVDNIESVYQTKSVTNVFAYLWFITLGRFF